MAAGLGKRMRSSRPKVLHPIAGRPMLAHVLDAARALSPEAIAVVVGHGGDEVERALAAPGLAFVRQEPPRGTGDAVRVALAALPRDGVTVVTNGDTPLIASPMLAALAERAARGRLALLT
ncbi:MAG: NTP transferase domain-containing protein, partial [Burkholderiales bacterium]|nr:NTP transferase domain-containing protein [Burkholderiales bacterium]